MTSTALHPTQTRTVGRRLLEFSASSERYHVRLAETRDEIRAAQTLRFLTFNLEQNHDSGDAFATFLDSDPFDAQCDHLIAEDTSTNEIIGTYRLQTGLTAQRALGYYAAQRFDLSPLEPFRGEIIEAGRACVRRDHRHRNILGLLWKALLNYASARDARYLIGSSSLTTTNPNVGARAYLQLQSHLAPIPFRSVPLSDCVCDLSQPISGPVRLPGLLLAYLSLGAKVCSPPAIDRHFNQTVIFLTMLDLRALSARA